MASGSVSTTSAPQLAAQKSGSRLGRNIAVLAGGQLATWSLSFLWTIFVPLAVGPRGVGELTIAGAVTGVVSVLASLGIGTLMVKEIARDHLQAPRLVGSALLVRAAFIPPSLAAVSLYIVLARSGGEQATVIWLAAAAMTLGLLTQPFQSAFQGLERMQYLAYGDVLTKAVMTILGIGLVIAGVRVVGLMQMAVVIAVAALLLNVWWSRGNFGIDWAIDRERIRFLVVASLPYWTTGLVLTVYMWIDSLMLSVMSSDVVVGYYAVPTRIFNTLLFVPVILGTAMLPRLTAAFRDGGEAMRRVGKPALEIVIILSLPVAVGAALVAKSFIGSIYGWRFDQSAVVLSILALTLPPTYFNIMANQVLIATNRQVVWTKVMIGAAIINPVINLFLIRYFQDTLHNGAIGAAVTLMTTELGMALVGLFLLPPMLDARSLLRLLRAILATAGMALVVLTVITLGYGFHVQTLAGAITFVCLGLALRLLTPAEVTMLRKMLARLATKASGGSGYSTSQYHGWEDVTVDSMRMRGR